MRIGMASVAVMLILLLDFGMRGPAADPDTVRRGFAPMVPATQVDSSAPASGWIVAASLAAALLVTAVLLLRGRSREHALRQDHADLDARLHGYANLSHAFDLTAVFIRTADGTISQWSPGCERLFGFTAANAVGHLVQELLGTRFPEGGRRAAQVALARDGEWQGELRHRRRDGTPIIVAAHWILPRDAVSPTSAVTGPKASSVLEVHADATALKAAEAALNAGEARLRLAQDVASVGTWEWDPEADSFVWSPEQHALFGTPPSAGPPASHEAFLALIHPDDRDAVRAVAAGSRDSGEYDAEFRILRSTRDGSHEVRWLIGRGRRMPGLVGQRGPILGVNIDITGRKDTEDRQALLVREVDHRAKNALAVVQAILRMTRADSPDSFARVVEGRVAALARAQTLLTKSRWVGADLVAMLQGEMAHFMGGAAPDRVTLSGPPVTVAPLSAQPLSMALHELATNAAKYGSLSSPGGTLALTWEPDHDGDRLRLRWTESGGPPIAAPPERSGFGSRVVRTTIREQLGGEVVFDWRPEGLVCDIAIPLGRGMARKAA